MARYPLYLMAEHLAGRTPKRAPTLVTWEVEDEEEVVATIQRTARRGEYLVVGWVQDRSCDPRNPQPIEELLSDSEAEVKTVGGT